MTASGEPATQGSAPVRLDGLDALRGIAALLVAVMHIQHISGGGDLFARAYLAVDVFFVLSGYVMARTYEPKFACGMRLRDFAAVRLKRLWPTMCIGALLGMAACWSDMAPLGSLMAFLMAALFIPFVFGYGIEILFSVMDRVVTSFTQSEGSTVRAKVPT